MNAEEVARFLGCSSKTVRRHLEKGTITASRKASGELKISDDQVEMLRLVLELEDTSRQVQPTASIGRPEQADMSRQVETDIDTLTARVVQLEHQPEISVLTRELGKLQAKVDVQDARIAELERRITELEGRGIPTQPQAPLYRYIVDREEAVTHEPPIRNVEPSSVPADIPSGSLLMTDFAALHNVHRSTALRHCTSGIKGDSIEAIERPKLGGRKGDMERWLTPEMQEAAIQFWIRHNVKFT